MLRTRFEIKLNEREIKTAIVNNYFVEDTELPPTSDGVQRKYLFLLRGKFHHKNLMVITDVLV